MSEQARSEEWRLEGEERRERVRREGRTTSRHCPCREKARLPELEGQERREEEMGRGPGRGGERGGEQEQGEGIGASKGMWAEEGALREEGLQ